jgi:hypothetical protein
VGPCDGRTHPVKSRSRGAHAQDDQFPASSRMPSKDARTIVTFPRARRS